MSLLSPYGLIGFCGNASVMGIVSGTPKVAQVELNTNFRTPPSTAASRRFMPLATLLRKYLEGFVIDSPTSALAAKCMMASGWFEPTAFRMVSRSLRQPSMNIARSSTADLCPSLRLSNTTTSCPASSSCSTQIEPM